MELPTVTQDSASSMWTSEMLIFSSGSGHMPTFKILDLSGHVIMLFFSSGSGHVPTFNILDLNGLVKIHFNYVWCNPNVILWQK